MKTSAAIAARRRRHTQHVEHTETRVDLAEGDRSRIDNLESQVTALTAVANEMAAQLARSQSLSVETTKSIVEAVKDDVARALQEKAVG